VLGFDRAKSGESQRITITVDSNEKVEESNEDNNDDTETLVIN
jgi:subtilase family serine protease